MLDADVHVDERGGGGGKGELGDQFPARAQSLRVFSDDLLVVVGEADRANPRHLHEHGDPDVVTREVRP